MCIEKVQTWDQDWWVSMVLCMEPWCYGSIGVTRV